MAISLAALIVAVALALGACSSDPRQVNASPNGTPGNAAAKDAGDEVRAGVDGGGHRDAVRDARVPGMDAADTAGMDTAADVDIGADVWPPNPIFEAAEASPGTWVWLEPGGVFCRDGSPTGFGVRLRGNSDDLIIFLMGGGACFSPLTCSTNPKTYGQGEFDEQRDTLDSAFFINDPASPVADWNQVFIPYCTGDLHAGTLEDAEIPDCPLCPRNQQFVGYRNMQRYLELLVPYFADVDEVVLSGSSAGGFGATFNYAQTAAAFGRSPLLLNDSGPMFASDAVIPPCLDDHFVATWGLDAIFPSGCAGCDAAGQRLQALMPYLSQTFPDGAFAFLGAAQDTVIRLFMNHGAQRCGAGMVDANDMQVGTYDLVDNVLTGWSTFVVPDDSHVQLTANSTAGGMDLATFLTDVRGGAVINADDR